MSKELFGDRRQSLEESFFAKENEKAKERLRAAQEASETKEGLRSASGIQDEAVLDALVDLGFTAETVAALSLYPLVAVAWADRSIKITERRAVLDAAQESGIAKGDPCHELLENWLDHRPEPALMDAWRNMAGALKQSLSAPVLDTLKRQLLDRAEEVAQAAGGFLGMASISDEEKQVLAELEAAFD